MSSPQITVDPKSAGVTVDHPDPTPSVIWDRAVQTAVIAEGPGPTIASRAYAITHTSMFEAWASYDGTAIGPVTGDTFQVPASAATDANKASAMHYAAYTALLDLFPDQKATFDAVMSDLGLSTDLDAATGAAKLGVDVAREVVADRADDGSNQANGYADTSGYQPTNTDPDSIVDIALWTPETVPIDGGAPESLQQFLTPHWGLVTPFSLDSGDALRPVAPEPFFDEDVRASINMKRQKITIEGLSEDAERGDMRDFVKGLRKEYKGTDDFDKVKAFVKEARAEWTWDQKRAEFREIKKDLLDFAKGTKLEDGVRAYVKELGRETRKEFKAPDAEPIKLDVDKKLIGPVINAAFIKQSEDLIETSANLTDEQKAVAEFWEDGGGTAFPPGTWMTFGEFVSARDGHTLDEDAKLFFALSNAVMDAGIATWEAKEFYDYARPVRTIRELGEMGLIGEDVDGVAMIEAYDPATQTTQMIPATQFNTYQNQPNGASPPFSEYTSGHSSFSAAGAEILRSFTGSDQFGASVSLDTLIFEDRQLDTPIELAWSTFTEAADEGGISRIYGGIHFDDGDINGRTLGSEVGGAVWDAAQDFFDGTAIV